MADDFYWVQLLEKVLALNDLYLLTLIIIVSDGLGLTKISQEFLYHNVILLEVVNKSVQDPDRLQV